MISDRDARHFVELGMAAEEAASRAALVARVAQGFREVMGAPPEWRWFVPGRIEVLGKHTDYAGGHSLLAAVPRGFGVAARPRPGTRVRVIDVRHGEVADVDSASDAKPDHGFGAYVHVVARRLARNFPGAELGLDVAIASDLPRAAGVSSSSALVVAIGAALARRASLPERDDWRQHIQSARDLAWYLGCVENGLDYPGLPGTAGVGTHGGSEDHTAILACRAGFVSHYGFVPVHHVDDVAMPAGWTFVVASSGVQADKAGSVKDRYNRASLATRALLALWNARAPEPAHSLRAAIAGDGRERLHAWTEGASVPGFTGADLRRRLEHFANEDARVHRMAEAFRTGDTAAAGEIAAESQRDAVELLGNQIPETCALVSAARVAGAWAASSFGAGFGGSAWALVPADGADRIAHDWLDRYRRDMPHVPAVEYFVAHPGPPATELP